MIELSGKLTTEQHEALLEAVPGSVIEEKQRMSYVPQWFVRAELNRIFGHGRWDSQVHDVTLLYEEQRNGSNEQTKNKTYWFAGYRVAVTLRVRDFHGNPVAEFTEYHAEENAPDQNRGEAHAKALTSCASYALRRAAIGLGDAFGLHLYDKGSKNPVVDGSLLLDELEAGQAPPASKAPDGAPAAEQRSGGKNTRTDHSEGATAVTAAFNHPEGRKD